MRVNISKIVYAASWLAVVLAVLATAFWISIVADGNYCWAAFAFAMGIATPLSIGTLLLGAIPSGVLYVRHRQRRDGISLLLAGCSLAIVLIQAVSLFIIPQRGE